jgi:prevent-host-death family protein
MLTSTVDEAQAQFAQLIGLAERGEEVVIARAGKPVARIVPYCPAEGSRKGRQLRGHTSRYLLPTRSERSRKGGQWRGQVHITPDFDELPPNLREAFGLPEK